jgi:GH15 family glucan-1,4-alpha-glucosidase
VTNAAPAASAAARGYRDIRDYAVIGDCSGAALVARDGGIDWCALGRIDADPVCCRILDAARGGFFAVRVHDAIDSTRRYLADTNVLETTFSTARGAVIVTDFMVLGRRPGSRRSDYVSIVAPGWLVRCVRAERGAAAVEVTFRPSVDWAANDPQLRAEREHAVSWADGAGLLSDTPLQPDGHSIHARFELAAGESRSFVLARSAPADARTLLAQVPALLATTCAYWRELAASCRYDGRYAQSVRRGALALKLMTHAPSGAIAAAATTSLPECIGGERNWDYRYCWLRDATLTLFALAALGYGGEAARFSEFLFRCSEGGVLPGQIMYGVGGETVLDERELSYLDGYRGSRPVRIGNAAYRQRQLDVFGEIMDWALLRERLGWRFTKRERELLRSTADFVLKHWREPDQGIWEMRNEPQHHVYGKIMSWVALDRAARLRGNGHRDYARAAAEILGEIRAQGIAADGSLRQAFGSARIDAALLLAPVVDFPLDAGVLEATIAGVRKRLQRGAFVYRYDSDDGIPGGEGAFVACSFWLVDALLFAGRVDEARELYERLLALANDVGLFSEEIEPDTNAFLGNFPQAFTHLSVIHSATLFEIVERYGTQALKGAHADRVRCAFGATEASRAPWQRVFKHAREALRRSSRASMLDVETLLGSH